MPILLGAIADDMTGATDLANTLVRQGMRTVQLIGVPGAGEQVLDADAIVIALKSRTIPAADAVAQSRAALACLRSAGARQFFFKYCSTFDSTDAGNIGPVADALLDELGADFTIACPAFPANGRTIYQGHLFVGDRLLSQSSMRNHPLTPMLDSDLVQVLQRQTKAKVGLVPFPVVDQGADAIGKAFTVLQASGSRHAIVDATSDRHLLSIGKAAAALRLITGGSGVALGLPENFRQRGFLPEAIVPAALPEVQGPSLVISGSCSVATLGQIAMMKAAHDAFELDPLALASGQTTIDEIVAWAKPKLGRKPILIYASAPPDSVKAVQAELGRERAGELVEHALSEITARLVKSGVRRIVVAGGETSGAVLTRLGVRALRIGPEIDPGVPWTTSLGAPNLALALKSGNFGTPDFFAKALVMLT